jgi:hypothetical protein
VDLAIHLGRGEREGERRHGEGYGIRFLHAEDLP